MITYQFTRIKSKTRKDGTAPIYLRLHNGVDTKDVSLRVYVHENEWLADHQTSKRHDINALLGNVSTKLTALVHNTDLDEVIATLFPPPVKKMGFLELFAEHNHDMQKRIGKDFAKNTYAKYTSTYNIFSDFVRAQYNKNDILISDLTPTVFENYWSYLIRDRGYQNNSAMKAIGHIRKITNLALKRDLLEKNPFRNWKRTHKAKPIVHLTEAELKRVEDLSFDIQRLETIRLMFLLACYTGLSYSDLMKLERNDLISDNEGDVFLVQPRTKTNNISTVYVNEDALKLIEMLTDISAPPHVVPRLSNQKYNAYLKEIADIARINKRLTTHTARRTFATLNLNRGVPLESISHALAHADIRMTQRYAQISTHKIKQDFKRVNG